MTTKNHNQTTFSFLSLVHKNQIESWSSHEVKFPIHTCPLEKGNNTVRETLFWPWKNFQILTSSRYILQTWQSYCLQKQLYNFNLANCLSWKSHLLFAISQRIARGICKSKWKVIKRLMPKPLILADLTLSQGRAARKSIDSNHVYMILAITIW